MSRYERVTLTPEDGKKKGRTFILKVTSEDSAWLRGYEVNKSGEDIEGADFDQRLHLIDKSAVTVRVPMTMNKHYCELEVDTTEQGRTATVLLLSSVQEAK